MVKLTSTFSTLLGFTLISISNTLQCYVCCGCNGESSTACSSYGSAYNSYFATALNSKDAGKAMSCELEPKYANNKPDDVRGDELLLASVTPACSQVIYYDTTFNEDLTLKMCMSLEACEAQRELIGKSTHVYLGRDTAVYVDVLSVQCCTDELCNNLSAQVSPPAVHQLQNDEYPPPLPMPIDPMIESGPTTVGPMNEPLMMEEVSALLSADPAVRDFRNFNSPLMAKLQPLTPPPAPIRALGNLFANFIEQSSAFYNPTFPKMRPPMQTRDHLMAPPPPLPFNSEQVMPRFMHEQSRIVPRAGGRSPPAPPPQPPPFPGAVEVPNFAMISELAGPQSMLDAKMQAIKLISGNGADGAKRSLCLQYISFSVVIFLCL